MSPAKKKQLKAEAERDPRCKRPMNAFMLYAKKHRVILMQKFPGRDNRYLYWDILSVVIVIMYDAGVLMDIDMI